MNMTTAKTKRAERRQLRRDMRDFLFKLASRDTFLKLNAGMTRKWDKDRGCDYDSLNTIINNRSLTQFHRTPMAWIAGVE